MGNEFMPRDDVFRTRLEKLRKLLSSSLVEDERDAIATVEYFIHGEGRRIDPELYKIDLQDLYVLWERFRTYEHDDSDESFECEICCKKVHDSLGGHQLDVYQDKSYKKVVLCGLCYSESHRCKICENQIKGFSHNRIVKSCLSGRNRIACICTTCWEVFTFEDL